MIISVDFDGVITSEDRFPEIGKLAPNCKQTMTRLSELGVTWVLNTCRVDEHLQRAIDFCLEQKLPIEHVNRNVPERIEMYGGDCRKISADMYIDDKMLGGFPGWAYTGMIVKPMLRRRQHD